MSLDASLLVQHRQLMLDDVEHALTGVSASLGLDAQGLPQASLHARDLAQALGGAGLLPVARLVEDIAQRLSQGELQAMFLARGLIPILSQWVAQTRQGLAEPDTAVLAQIAHWQQRLAEQPAPPAADLPPVDDLSPPPSRPLLRRGLEAPQIHASGLGDLARIRSELHLRSLSPQALDVRLSAFEDWLVSLGQFALADIYMAPQHQVQGAWADQALLDFIKGSLNWAYRAQSLRAATCQLTLRMDWVGAHLENSEAHELGQQVARLEGRLEALPEGGWRLWLPACRQRMRLQTFTQEGQPFAISAALLAQPPAPGDRELRLRVGLEDTCWPVDAVGRQASMNLHPLPASVPMPRRVGAVAVDPAGALFPLLTAVEQRR